MHDNSVDNIDLSLRLALMQANDNPEEPHYIINDDGEYELLIKRPKTLNPQRHIHVIFTEVFKSMKFLNN